ncbi:BadF/BadG/BcrA/BcrD ATPase family protein [Tropicimonas sp.]|uniref:BadF/BadG/BcrA/BcrD ATPase family protein n=1 Tax=Tropicimonas sp. TaxID=2067044 RepID=UPI003A88E959
MQHASPQILIGVDGGGTSCRVALAVDGERFDCRRGPANVSTDFAGAVATVLAALADAADSAGLTMGDIARATAHVGLAGVMSPAIASRVAAELPVGRVCVTDDRPTTVAGALGDADGAVAAIGTGSFLGRQVAGRITGLGGWGFYIGDQAAGAWLMRRAFEELMLAVDGLAEMTPFAGALLAEHGNDPGAVVQFSLRSRPVDYARLAVRIVDAAEAGDPLATRLMTEGAAYIRRGLDRLGWTPAEPLCLTGGLGPAYGRWLGLASIPPRGTALDGALILAARLRAREEDGA